MIDDPVPHPPEYGRYFDLFNERDFFEAHEVLEDLWVVETGENRNYYKGLIMAAVAILHWQRGNASGAARLHRDAMVYLRAYPARHESFDLGGFRDWMDEAFQPLVRGDSDAPPPAEAALPRLVLSPGSDS